MFCFAICSFARVVLCKANGVGRSLSKKTKNSANILLNDVIQSYPKSTKVRREFQVDVRIDCIDGSMWAHRIVCCNVCSGFRSKLLQSTDRGHWLLQDAISGSMARSVGPKPQVTSQVVCKL